ncbi:MAG: endonuclease/exonuclease/phosphatase family protein [Salinibacter sp.]
MLRRSLWAVVNGGAALLVACFLLGYTAPFLPPTLFWWANLLAVGLGPLAVGAGGVALVLAGRAWHRRQWLPGGAALVLMALLLARFGPSLGAWSASPADDGLRIMSFNVPGTYTPDGAAPALASLLDREAPAVLALQESRVHTHTADRSVSVSPSLRDVIQDPTGYTLPLSLPWRTVIQQPVLGRIPLDSLQVHPLPPDGDSSARSRFTRTHFQWQNRPVVLFNLHLHTVGSRPWAEPGAWTDPARWWAFLQTYRTGALHRAEQARRVRRAIEQAQHPVLVTGDFNSTRHQWAYRHIAQGLQDAVTQRGRGWSATFPARRPLVRIDHVLAGPAWRVGSAGVRALDGYEAVSDHRPVVATLHWSASSPE